MRKIIFIVILALAIFLRIFKLDIIPPSLNWDEVSLGYNAFSILQTGKDEWGESFPLSFRAYGDYKLPGYVYLDTIFVSIFGLNEWGVRLPSVFLGVGLVVLVFLILKKFRDMSVAFWGMFVAAILPWSLITSRIALEAQLALFLTTLGVYCFYKGLKNPRWFILSALSLGLTIFSYNSSRVVTPLLIVGLAILYWKEISNKKLALLSIAIFGVFFSLALPRALLQDSSARYRWTMILDEGAINRINEMRGNSELPAVLPKVVYNKITYSIAEISKNYLSHFSPNFLFLNGGSNYQFSVPGSGLVYPILAPFLLLGFWKILKQRKKSYLFTGWWLMVAVIPAAITRDSPHALRSLIMIPPVIIIASLGITIFLSVLGKRKQIIKVVLVSLFIGSLYLFWQNYTNEYVKNYSWVWQYGYEQASEFIKKEGNNYDQIFITKRYGEPHEFVLFYLNYDPEKYRNDRNLVRYQKSDWFWVDGFDKYIFINDWEIKEKAVCSVECLLVTSPGNYPIDSKLLEKVNFLDGKEAFDIVEPPRVQ